MTNVPDASVNLKSICGYRRTYLINTLHNKIFGSVFIPVLKSCIISGIFVTVAAIVIFRDAIGPLLTVIFVIYIIALFSIIIPASLLMTKIYYKSKTFHEEMNILLRNFSNPKSSEVIYLRKALKSLPIMKSQIGSFYYMENEAKLTLMDNLVNGIVFMLLTF